MTFDCKIGGNILMVTLRGWMHIDDVAALRNAVLKQLNGREDMRVIYDLSQVTGADTKIIAALSRAGLFPQNVSETCVIGSNRALYAQVAFQIAAQMSGHKGVRYDTRKLEEHDVRRVTATMPVFAYA